mgnify:FL=1
MAKKVQKNPYQPAINTSLGLKKNQVIGSPLPADNVPVNKPHKSKVKSAANKLFGGLYSK